MKKHHYKISLKWTGNTGAGTTGYTDYKRDHTISAEGKSEILASSDPAFLGDKTKYNPEDLLVASLSTCHMLWYLHLCADAGITVTDYIDRAEGTITEDPAGGRFKEVILHPLVTISDISKKNHALALHDAAHKKCFIANSCNFPVIHKPECTA